jgi:hypothetical protein
MEFLQYIFRFLYRIRWWLIIAPLLVALAVFLGTRNMERSYPVDMTIYTGIVSGYAMETGETSVQNSTVVNNTIDNIINIILSKETLREVCLHLYARHMIYGDPDKDNEYISAANYSHLQRITPAEVKMLIDTTSEEKTVENLKGYEKACLFLETTTTYKSETKVQLVFETAKKGHIFLSIQHRKHLFYDFN